MSSTAAVSPLRVKSITVRNVLGITRAAIEPGRVTVIRGKNGSAKSSLLQALQSGLGGGSLATLARLSKPGEETPEPEIVLVIGGPGLEEYRVKRTAEKVEVQARVGETAAFEKIGKPQAWLTSLFDPDGANPVAFLNAKDKDRGRMMLEALDLPYQRAELLAAMGIEPGELPAIPEGLHPLEDVATVRDAVFRQRTGVNTNRTGKTHAAEQVRRSAPAVIPGDPKAAIAELEGREAGLVEQAAKVEELAKSDERQAVEAAHAAHNLEEEKITSAYRDDRLSKLGAFEKWEALRRATVEKEIAAERAKVEAELATFKAASQERLDAIGVELQGAERKASAARQSAEAGLAALRQSLADVRVELARYREASKSAASTAALHAQAKTFDEEAAELEKESARLTTALEALDAFRLKMAAELPIEGLEIDGRMIRVGGIPFDQLNTAQRVKIAVQVSTMRARRARLPVVFVDGAEALDHDNFAELVAELDRLDVQAFVARVEEGELQVGEFLGVTAVPDHRLVMVACRCGYRLRLPPVAAEVARRLLRKVHVGPNHGEVEDLADAPAIVDGGDVEAFEAFVAAAERLKDRER